MELFKSLQTRTKQFNDPFKHFEINEPLTGTAIKEICNAEIDDSIFLACGKDKEIRKSNSVLFKNKKIH